MKILYSQLKQLVPGLKAAPQEIGEKFTLAGLMMDGLKEVKYQGKQDWLISLEVRQNRADCLGVLGLARETAAYYGLPLKLPDAKLKTFGFKKTKIEVLAKKEIKRALAFEIEGLKNRESPAWLKDFLALYDINPINFLVDLSNYAMIFTGYPSHLLDVDKMNGGLHWDINLVDSAKTGFKKIITLDGTEAELNCGEIILRDEKNILGLAGIVGSKQAAIDFKTSHIIAEMAIYDRVIVRQNSRSLKIMTEASTRLGKDLDPDGLDFAMNFLLSLILKKAGGKVLKPSFSYYPKRRIVPKIKFNPNLPSEFAGIEIPIRQCLKVLKDLRFKVKVLGKVWQVEPPLDRMDINIEEDVVEEVVRLVGFNKIPANELPAFKATEKITPKRIELEEKVKDILLTLGFDEILSWPLTNSTVNGLTNWRVWQEIATQNSVNEEFPVLRQSLAAGLLSQKTEYEKRNIEKIRLFEIGKTFGMIKEKYKEIESLGLLAKWTVKETKAAIETLLRSLGVNDIEYKPDSETGFRYIGHPARYKSGDTKCRAANPYSIWKVCIGKNILGIFYKFNPTVEENLVFAEFDIDEISLVLKDFVSNPVKELEQKLVILDANAELAKNEPIGEFLKKAEQAIGKSNFWGLEIKDAFPVGEKIRYTVRVSYMGLTDEQAKEKHLEVFNLKNPKK